MLSFQQYKSQIKKVSTNSRCFIVNCISMGKTSHTISNFNRKVKCSNHRSNVFENNKRLSLQGLNRPTNLDVKVTTVFFGEMPSLYFRNAGKLNFLLFSEGQLLSPKKGQLAFLESQGNEAMFTLGSQARCPCTILAGH